MSVPSQRASPKTFMLALSLLLSGCATLSGEPRAARSTTGCARAVLSSKVPAGLSDKHTHCMAAGMIARYCSVPEAYLAAVGKEIKDLFTPGGDAQWSDLRADSAGIRCAGSENSDTGLAVCCEQAISRYTPANQSSRAPGGNNHDYGQRALSKQ